MRQDRVPFVDGDEQDALAGWRQVYRWRPGQVKKIKRRYNKRLRRAWRRGSWM